MVDVTPHYGCSPSRDRAAETLSRLELFGIPSGEAAQITTAGNETLRELYLALLVARRSPRVWISTSPSIPRGCVDHPPPPRAIAAGRSPGLEALTSPA